MEDAMATTTYASGLYYHMVYDGRLVYRFRLSDTGWRVAVSNDSDTAHPRVMGAEAARFF
jgi:hypothetical protein